MSVGPVGNSAPIPEPENPESKVRPATASPRPNSESAQVQETAKLKNVTPVPTLPENEVKVQWDTPMSDYIVIYRVLDQQSGGVVLQEPSEQVLNLIHQIQQTLQQSEQAATAAINAPEAAPPGSGK